MKLNQDKIDQLIALIDGSLAEKEKKALKAELKENPELAEMYEIVKDMSVLSGKSSKQIISATQQLSKKLYQDFLKNKESADSEYGVLVFDSSLLPIPEGIRPASVETKQLKYQIGEASIEVTIYPITVDSVEIIGQIHGEDIDDTFSIVVKAKSHTYNAPVDKFGLFRFERISTGNCLLFLICDNKNKGIIELIL